VAQKNELDADQRVVPWSIIYGMVAFNDCLYTPLASPLLQEVLTAVHTDGHEGVQHTLHRLRRDFHSPNLRTVVQDYVRACTTCQRHKSEHPAGLLMPLPVLTTVWADIGLDFIEALPRVGGKSVILTVVDRLSKYCHFIPLAHLYSAESVAQAFFAEVVMLCASVAEAQPSWAQTPLTIHLTICSLHRNQMSFPLYPCLHLLVGYQMSFPLFPCLHVM